MLFTMTKVITQILYPLDMSLLVALAAGIFLWRRRTKIGGALLAFAIAWLWLWSTPVFSYGVRGALEQEYMPVRVEQMESADAIVVLGGGTSIPHPPRLYAEISAPGDRILHAARLYKAGKAPWVIVSGIQEPDPPPVKGPKTNAMRSILEDLGVPETAIIAEEQSRNTRENAQFTKRILDARGFKKVLLVTSALHMPRAMAEFRSVCSEVIPAPTDFEVEKDRPFRLLDWLPNADALEGSSRAFKEIIGGWVKAVFTQ